MIKIIEKVKYESFDLVIWTYNELVTTYLNWISLQYIHVESVKIYPTVVTAKMHTFEPTKQKKRSREKQSALTLV